MRSIFNILLLALAACNNPGEQYRSVIDLQGQWQFALDTANTGEGQQWYLSDTG
jgi:hypothetical protein